MATDVGDELWGEADAIVVLLDSLLDEEDVNVGRQAGAVLPVSAELSAASIDRALEDQPLLDAYLPTACAEE
ncbi:hypothetical protein [Actinomadura formosensis]|uniref:hypothetical protein n=1 Tax=Actinomadura formosensis TaxID=60706 RepID=UPI00082A8265|nr:hypothetical protein [Actinomadura formosensis]